MCYEIDLLCHGYGIIWCNDLIGTNSLIFRFKINYQEICVVVGAGISPMGIGFWCDLLGPLELEE